MEILLLLIPLSVVLVGAAIALFLWAVRHHQFDALEERGSDVLAPPLATSAEQSERRQSIKGQK